MITGENPQNSRSQKATNHMFSTRSQHQNQSILQETNGPGPSDHMGGLLLEEVVLMCTMAERGCHGSLPTRKGKHSRGRSLNTLECLNPSFRYKH